MEQNTNQDQQIPEPKRGMSAFRKGLFWTVIPISLVGIISSIASPVFTLSWIVALGLWILALIAAIVLAIIGKRRLASGMFVGLGLSFVVLGVTCFTAPLLTR